jgi:hypothetical protein
VIPYCCVIDPEARYVPSAVGEGDHDPLNPCGVEAAHPLVAAAKMESSAATAAMINLKPMTTPPAAHWCNRAASAYDRCDAARASDHEEIRRSFRTLTIPPRATRLSRWIARYRDALVPIVHRPRGRVNDRL